MNTNSMNVKFSPALIGLHWLMLLMILGSYLSLQLSELYPDESSVHQLLQSIHFSLGVSILGLVIVRVLVRISSKTPAIIPPPSAKQELLAKMMHLALYLFMFAMPILGWLIVSAEGETVSVWGLFTLPPLIGESEEIEDIVHELHELGATLGYFFIGLHAAAGLFHHYKLKDYTLLRMSFFKK